MSEISGLGKVIEVTPGIKKFENIEEARKAAESRSGNEAIVKNDDGTYSLFEISETKDQEKNVIAMAEKGNIAQFDPKVVEFSIGGMIWDKSIRTENQSKELNDISEVGSKINSAYLDNTKGKNKFGTEEEAIAAAKKHEGIEAVVKNADGTFSLYRASQEQMDKVMNDSNYSGKVVKFVVPESSFFGLSSSEKVVTVNRKAPPVDTSTPKPPVTSEIPAANKPSGTAKPEIPSSVPQSQTFKADTPALDKLKGIDLDKFKGAMGDFKHLPMALERMASSPDFQKKLDSLMKDPNVSNELKEHVNNGIKALNQVIAAMEAGKSTEEIKALLNQKSGDLKVGDLIMSASFMTRYHDKNKNNSEMPSVDKVFQTEKQVEKELKAKNGGAEVPRAELFKEVNSRLGLAKGTIDHGAYLEATDKKIDNLKQDTNKLELDSNLAKFMEEQTGSVKNLTSGINELNELNSLLDKINSGGKVTFEEIEKLKEVHNKTVSSIDDGTIKLSADQSAAVKELSTAFKTYETAKADYDKKTETHNNALDKTKETNRAFVEVVQEMKNNPDLKPGERRLIHDLDAVFTEYQRILDKGDPAEIALFGRYMEKMTDALKNKTYQQDPQILETLTKEYMAIESQIKNTNTDSPTSQDATFSAIKEYLGEHSPQAELFRNIVYPPQQSNFSYNPGILMNNPLNYGLPGTGGYEIGGGLKLQTSFMDIGGGTRSGGIGGYSPIGGNLGSFGLSSSESGKTNSLNLFNSTGTTSMFGGSSSLFGGSSSLFGGSSSLFGGSSSLFGGSSSLFGGSSSLFGGSSSLFGGSSSLFGGSSGLFGGSSSLFGGSGSSGPAFQGSNLGGLFGGSSSSDGGGSSPFAGLSSNDFNFLNSTKSFESALSKLSSSNHDMMLSGTAKSQSKSLLDSATMDLMDKILKAGPGQKTALMAQMNMKENIQSMDAALIAHALKRDEIVAQTDQLIMLADDAQASLDLEIDGSAADMTNLLVKFREIISKLDIDMRKAIQSKLEQIMVDQAIANSENAEKDMKRMLDSLKKGMDKLFDTSKEVKVNELSNDMKKAVMSGLVQFSSLLK